MEGRDDAITVENKPFGAPSGLTGFATADPNSAASLQVNLRATAPQPFVMSNYVIFGLGPLNDDGLYSWATICTSRADPRIYILVRDLDDFAANAEVEVLRSLRALGFYFDGEDPNPDIPELRPVIKSNNENC